MKDGSFAFLLIAADLAAPLAPLKWQPKALGRIGRLGLKHLLRLLGLQPQPPAPPRVRMQRGQEREMEEDEEEEEEKPRKSISGASLGDFALESLDLEVATSPIAHRALS